MEYTKQMRNEPYHKLVTPIGRALWWTGCVRYYRDGDGIGAVFHWWHPVTWIVWIITLQICGLIGEPIFNVVPLKLSKYWKDKKEEMEWF
jgi:hypothetical protein